MSLIVPASFKSDTLGLGRILFLLVGILLAVSFGLLATSANPVFIGVGTGLLVGVLLVGKPSWNIWLILSFGLLVEGLIPIWIDEEASSNRAALGVSLLGFLLMISAFIRAVTTPKSIHNTPIFVWLALGFLVYVIFLSLIQWHSLTEFFGGMKKYFHVYGLLFAFSWLLFDDRIVRSWRGFLLLVAIAQLPAVIYELIVIVPKRAAVAAVIRDLIPIDGVGGTLGTGIMTGGASSEMAFFLIVIMGFLFSRWKEGVLSAGKLTILVPIIAAPLFMGETKAVLIQLPLMFMIIFIRDSLTKPLMVLMMASILISLIVVAVISYARISKMTVDELFEGAMEYNVREQGYGNRLLNRKTALIFWAEQQSLTDPISPIFGNGAGSAEGGTANALVQGHIAVKYPRLGIALTDASQFLWEIGVFGCILFLAILVNAWLTAGLLYRRALDPTIRADGLAIQVIIALLVFHLFYRNALLHLLPFQILIFFALGYLAWLYRQYLGSEGVSV